MVAGRTLTRRRRGYAPRMATMTVRATEIGYTMRRGAAATPKTALPKAMESAMPAAAPMRPPTRPRITASVRKRLRTRRVGPPMDFIIAASFLRSAAILGMAGMIEGGGGGRNSEGAAGGGGATG